MPYYIIRSILACTVCSHLKPKLQAIFCVYSGVTTILHVYAFLLTWNFLALVASSPLIGTISTMTASPAKTDGPNSSHRKAMDRMICRGQDHSRWMKLVTSLKRWASADIRFTVSPTVDSLRASLETTNALEKG